MKNTENLIEKLFSLLDKWKNLPAYQLERRADIFFALYLPEIIKKKFNCEVIEIIPEFPVKKNENNRSEKIDYVVVCENKVFFIELKTDINSCNEQQERYYSRAKENNISKLVDGILEIYQATNSKKKYNHLLDILSSIGWVKDKENTSHDYEIEIVYIQPSQDRLNKTIILFDEIINYLSDKEDVLSKRFLKSLNDWKLNKNRRII